MNAEGEALQRGGGVDNDVSRRRTRTMKRTVMRVESRTRQLRRDISIHASSSSMRSMYAARGSTRAHSATRWRVTRKTTQQVGVRVRAVDVASGGHTRGERGSGSSNAGAESSSLGFQQQQQQQQLDSSSVAAVRTEEKKDEEEEDDDGCVVSGESSNDDCVVGVCLPAFPLPDMAVDVRNKSVKQLCEEDAVYNHEDSWLRFNWRVLNMARNENVPTMERLKFVAIAASNMDEFMMKRVGGLKRQMEAGVRGSLSKMKKGAWLPQDKLQRVHEVVRNFVNCQEECLTQTLLPELSRNGGIRIVRYSELSPTQERRLQTYFRDVVEKLLTPLAVDPGHPFPTLDSLHLSIAVELEYLDPAKTRETQFEVIKVPSPMLDRWLRVDASDSSNVFLPLEDLILANLSSLTEGMRIVSKHVFRVTRNAEIERHEDEADDLFDMVFEEMRTVKFAPFVRLEVDASMPERVVKRLEETLDLDANGNDTYKTRSFLGLADLMSVDVNFGRGMSALCFTPYRAEVPELINKVHSSIFDAIRQGDILLHHPYHSFKSSVQAFFEQAASDPRVKTIRATLYRTSKRSPIIRALKKAAEKGISVFILVEIKARFDEERNIEYVSELESSGCNVAYGLVGSKTHSKTAMVVRKDDDGVFREYVHVGTGNYNPVTAEIYSDCGVLTCDENVARDVRMLFMHLMSMVDQPYHEATTGGGPAYRRLLIAPFYMQQRFVELIHREAENAARGLPAAIHAKMNGLDDPRITAALYGASAAGVNINLVVRGICRPRPGVPGVSENIRVCSIIGRFLEHHRIFRFENAGGEPLYFIGSADWMTRNLKRRTEACVPITDDRIKSELQDILDGCLCDGTNSWELLPSGHYVNPPPDTVLDAAIEDAIARRGGSSAASQGVNSVWLRARKVGSQVALLEKHDTSYEASA